MPPLRDRREDFGRLFYYFLERELNAAGGARSLAGLSEGGRPWPPAEIVARLAAHPWPGNVRQLRNAARQLAILGPEASPAQLARWLESAGTERLPGPPTSPPTAPPSAVAASPPPRRLRPGDVSDDQLIAVLRECRYRVQDAAERLGMSRAAVYKLMDRSPRIRKAGDLDRTEIAEAIEECAGELAAMVDRLEVSAPGLRRRMRQLGFD